MCVRFILAGSRQPHQVYFDAEVRDLLSDGMGSVGCDASSATGHSPT